MVRLRVVKRVASVERGKDLKFGLYVFYEDGSKRLAKYDELIKTFGKKKGKSIWKRLKKIMAETRKGLR